MSDSWVYVKYDALEKTRGRSNLYSIKGREVWLPRDEIKDDPKAKVLVVPLWLATSSRLKGDW